MVTPRQLFQKRFLLQYIGLVNIQRSKMTDKVFEARDGNK